MTALGEGMRTIKLGEIQGEGKWGSTKKEMECLCTGEPGFGTTTFPSRGEPTPLY